MVNFRELADKYYSLDTAWLDEGRILGRTPSLAASSPGELTQILLFSYRPESLEDPPRPLPTYGLWSAISRGQDYHKCLRKLALAYAQDLQAGLGQLLEEDGLAAGQEGNLPSFSLEIDTEPAPERYLAWEAGLGFIGRSQNFIHPTYGSYILIACLRWRGEGQLLETLAKVTSDRPIARERRPVPATHPCGACRACQKACPGGALTGTCDYEQDRCLSYLTQKKGPLSDEEGHLIGYHLYGCDICQQVCPYNRKLEGREGEAGTKIPLAPDLLGDTDSAWTACIDFLQASKQDLQAQYAERSGTWRGWNQLKKNALWVLGNSWEAQEVGDPDMTRQVKNLFASYARNPSPVLRKTASGWLQSLESEEADDTTEGSPR